MIGLSDFQSLALLALAVGGILVTVTLYITTRVSAAEAKAAAAVEATEDKLRLLIEKNAEIEGNQRHKLAGAAQLADNEMRRDMEQLKRETVRREEMAAMEARVTTSITKLDTKMDSLAEKLGLVPALSERMRSFEEKIDRLIARHEGAKQ